MDPKIAEIEKEYVRADLPAFAPGDTVRVRVRVVEGNKERIQAFEGICIARKGGGTGETFRVRRISGGVGVERTFLLNSPIIAGLEVVRRGHVRRAKLYYLRARRGKRARVRERRWWLDAAREAKAGAVPPGEVGEPVVPGEEEAPEVMEPEDLATPEGIETGEAEGIETGEAEGVETAEAEGEVELDEDEAARREAAAEAAAE